MNDEKKVIAFDDAVKLLPDGDNIHTFRQPGGMMFIGADWNRAGLLDAMKCAPEIHVTGPQAQAMKHGLAIMEGGRWLFIEAANADEMEPA